MLHRTASQANPECGTSPPVDVRQPSRYAGREDASRAFAAAGLGFSTWDASTTLGRGHSLFKLAHAGEVLVQLFAAAISNNDDNVQGVAHVVEAFA